MRKWRILLSIITLIIFVVLLFTYEKTPIVKLDKTMTELLAGNEFIAAFHYIGDTNTIIIVSLIMLVLLWLKERNYRGMLFVLLTVGAGRILNQLIKNWKDRPRPEIVDQLTTFSFPSGYAMLSLLYLFTIAYLLSEAISSKTTKLIIWTLASILPLFIGLSRIADSSHFTSDVIAGWCLGYTWFVLCVIWYERKNVKQPNIGV